MLQLFEKMTPEEIKTARKEQEEVVMKVVEEKRKVVVETTSPLVTKVT